MNIPQNSLVTLVLALLLGMAYPASVIARDFEIFDGRVYNGKYYPRVDIIEWGTPSHMEFHIYSKSKPVDLTFELERTKGKVVMLVRYHMKDRGEFLCRRVLAPGHFLPGLKIYKDQSDKDFDNYIVSMEDMEPQPGLVRIDKPANYAACEDDSVKDRMPASEGNSSEAPGAPQAAVPAAPPQSPPERAAKAANPHEDGGGPFQVVNT